jgi:preprotein translocase subunit YajC
MNGPMLIVWILVFFGIFYFLAIRPQRRQKQAHADMVSMLKKGDEIVTIGGMFGTVTAIGDDWVEIEVAKRTRVRYLKRAVSSITEAVEDDDEDDEYIEASDDDVIEETVEDEDLNDPEADDAEVTEQADGETPAAPDTPEAPKA